MVDQFIDGVGNWHINFMKRCKTGKGGNGMATFSQLATWERSVSQKEMGAEHGPGGGAALWTFSMASRGGDFRASARTSLHTGPELCWHPWGSFRMLPSSSVRVGWIPVVRASDSVRFVLAQF